MNLDDQNEFQRVQPLVKVEEKIKHDFNKFQHFHQADQLQETNSKGWEFLQANPILPPGKYQQREEPKIQLKHSNRDKLNRSTFAVGTFRSKLSTNPLSQNQKGHSFSVNKNKSVQDGVWEEEEEELCAELRSIMSNKVQIYRRINNNNMNSLGKERERIVSSVFFDWRKEKIRSQQEPILEHLAKVMKIHPVRSESHWLSFSSEFESGNLFMALHNPQQSIPTYQLYMQNDINTKGCTQWYYFSVTNRSRGKVKFRLMNFYKTTSLYQKGMKVLYSYDRNQWKKTGTSIRYYHHDQGINNYALEFIHEFDSAKTTYFSYGYPYTYSGNLTNYLQHIFNQQKLLKVVRKSNLCSSAMGNPIPMLTISNFGKKEQRPIIYIIGRQHPGETPASFIVEGILNFLMSASIQAKELRDMFQFRVVPMVNVDGVISGNYRSNLSGSDVNRQWQFPSKKGQPQVFYLKQEVASNKKNTTFFLDIHAHSRKMNTFFYGSKAAEKDSKLFPFVCSKLNKFISYSESSFTDDPSKKTTARVVLENQINIPRSFTFEASFYGWVDSQKGNVVSFKQQDLRMIGESLGMAFYYSFIGMEKAKKVQVNNVFKGSSEKQKILMKNSAKMLDKWQRQLQKQAAEQKLEEEEEQEVFSEGSSLDPEHFQLKEEERKYIYEATQTKTDKAAEGGQQPSPYELAIGRDKDSSHRRNRMLIYSTLTPTQGADSKLLTRRDSSNGNSLGISSNEFYQISNTGRGKKKQPFSVRQLQLQLQYGADKCPKSRLRGVKLKMQQDPISSLARYESLDLARGNERVKNYKEDVLQMKRALKYLLQTKGSDYEQYRASFKTYTNENLGAGGALGKSERRYQNNK